MVVLDPQPAQEVSFQDNLMPDTNMTYGVFVRTDGNIGTTIKMQVSRDGVAAVFDLAYHASGYGEIEQILGELRKPPPTPTDEPARTRALAFAEVMQESFRRALRDTLKLIDDTAFEVFEEQLESARLNCGLSRCGMVGDELKSPVVDSNEARQEIYRDFRDEVVALTIATRHYESERARATLDGAEQRWRRQPDWAHVYNPAAPPVGAVEQSRRRFLAVWQQAAGKFPLIAVAGADLVKACVAVAQDDMAVVSELGDRYNEGQLSDLAKENAPYTNRLDQQLVRVCGEWMRKIRDAGLQLRSEYRTAADTVWTVATRMNYGTNHMERVLGEAHPLWRYPFLIREALQRIGAGPGSLAYSAAAHTLEIAADKAATDSQSAELRHEILALASMSFGVFSLLPVVGQAAGLAASACALVIAVPAILKYREDSKQYAAFGPYAVQHHLAAPDGVGLLINSLDAATAAMPLLGVAGRLAGRLIRLTAVQARTVGAVHAVADLAINSVAIAAAFELNKSQRP